MFNTRYNGAVCFRTETDYIVLSAAENGLKFLMNMLAEDRRYHVLLEFTRRLVERVYYEVRWRLYYYNKDDFSIDFWFLIPFFTYK